MKKRPTVREINSHLATMTTYCYIDMPDGSRMRISRARTRQGVLEGHQIGGECEWEPIPAEAVIHLTLY